MKIRFNEQSNFVFDTENERFRETIEFIFSFIDCWHIRSQIKYKYMIPI